MDIRGLFQSIFGKRPTGTGSNLPAFHLLSTFDSGFTPWSGQAWDIDTVREAVDAFARNASKIQPRHIRRSDGQRKNMEDRIDTILQRRPNPYMTAAAFYYKVAAQYVVYNNAFILPLFDGYGRLEAVYPINASRVELLESGGEMYARLIFSTGSAYIVPYSQIVHLRRHFLDNDIFGDDNRPLSATLETAHALNKSMSKFAELVTVIRGVLKANNVTKGEDLNKRRDDFIKDNLRMDANGAGIIVVDNKYEYTPISDKSTPIPKSQLDYVTERIYGYFGVNDKIVHNIASPEEMDAFYSGALVPFYEQLAQGLTNALFTEREQDFGNEIMCEQNRIQFETLEKRTTAAKFLTDIGALTLDQVLEIFGFAPIGGEEGKRRVQTLNMANAAIIDQYQLGKGSEETPPAIDTPKEPTKKETEEE